MECPICGEPGFVNIGRHWSSNRCEHPELSKKQREVTTGLLLGDGSIGRRSSGNPSIQAKMINYNYLNYVDNIFDKIGCGVEKVKTAAEQAKQNRESGFHVGADGDNYSDVYQWTSRRHPDFSKWESWYDTGEKVWPQDIELTPTVLKHWYCGDGNYHNNKSKSLQIATENEIENVEKIRNMFRSIGFEARIGNHWIRFTNDESKDLWEYMGKPLPGFEYKWPEEYR